MTMGSFRLKLLFYPSRGHLQNLKKKSQDVFGPLSENEIQINSVAHVKIYQANIVFEQKEGDNQELKISEVLTCPFDL